MLDIEIIKFEAQDVITASTATPCACVTMAGGNCDPMNGTTYHWIGLDANQEDIYCNGDHTCGKGN